MKGVIVVALKEMVTEKFGKETWEKVLKEAGWTKNTIFMPSQDVSDESVLKVVGSLCKVLNISLVQAADAFGDYWVNVYSQKIYKAFYISAKTAKDFLLSMNEVHVAMTKAMDGATPPKFEYEWENEKTLIMKYVSKRGLIDFMIGLIKGVAKFYKEDLKVTKLGDDKAMIVFP